MTASLASPLEFKSTTPEAAGFCPQRLENLGHVLQQQVDAQRVPGAVALVARRGKLVLHQSWGRQGPQGAAPMALDSLFRIYSMTKPLVSVAAMMLVERGQLLLSDSIAKHLPEFADVQVLVHVEGHAVTKKPRMAPTVQDLLRHTAGLTYEILGNEPIQRMYAQAEFGSRQHSNREFARALASMPLMFEPGTTFEYSRATDLLGALVEVVSGQTLGEFLRQHILQPLGMQDTVFAVAPDQHHRLAEPFARCPDSGAPVELYDVRKPYPMEAGGAGLVSTAMDYARFLQCLLDGGILQGQRLLAPSTVRNMTSDHLGGMEQHFTQRSGYMLPRGVGFGLGFAVRLGTGEDNQPGSAGLYYWGGVAGTTFFVDPAQELFGILMTQAPNQREFFRPLFRSLVYAALMD